jgi:AraC family transcriptional regulator of arabinose operon
VFLLICHDPASLTIAKAAKDMDDPVITMPSPPVYHIPFSVGYAENCRGNPNLIQRPGGADSWVLELCVKGSAEVIAPGGESLSFTEGDVFCYRPTIPQFYSLHPGEESWHHYWAGFSPGNNWLQWLQWPEAYPGLLALRLRDPNIRKRVRDLFQSLVEVGKSHYPHRRDLMMNLLEQILLWMEMENPRGTIYSPDLRIRKSLDFIDRHLGQPMAIEDLSRAAGISPSRFAHLFQEIMGLSPLRYIERRRIELATNLLLSTGKPISAIAQEVGYEDALYFSRVFRRATNASPRQYRQNAQRRRKPREKMDLGKKIRES